MTIQHAERRELNPLLLPLFGSPEMLEMKTWKWVGNDRQSITSSTTRFHLNYAFREIFKSRLEREPITIVFGTWEYVGEGLPSSALTLAKDEMPMHSGPRFVDTFSIRQPDGKDTYLRRLLRQFDKKMISFWWDSTTPLWIENGQENPIAELAIGGMNPSRFVAGTEMRLQLRFPTTTPWHWDLQTDTTVRIGYRDINWDQFIQLGLDTESSIPTTIYDAITKPLRDEMRYAVGLLKGMPQDTNKQIMKYLDFTKPIDEFDCKDGPKLLPLRIGELTIPPSMMYQQISPDKCKMTLVRNDDQAAQNVLIVGIDIIRHFYLSLIFDNWNSPTIQFATRVEGEAPAPPTGPPAQRASPTEPPCQSSLPPACITQNPSTKCCVIS